MGNLLNIYRRECAAYFNSPIAYIVIVAFLVFMSFLFFLFFGFFSQPDPDVRPYFDPLLPFVSIIFIPAITMRLWSEEKKQGTIELLMTLPMKSWEVVLGKFFAAYSVLAVMLLLTITIPLSISWVVDGLDWKAITSMYIGALLISAIYVALGSFVSSMTENQIVAYLVAVVLTAILCLAGFPRVIEWANDNLWGIGEYFGKFGTFFHYQYFVRGLFNLVDVVYALSVTALFLILNNVAVEGRKF